VCKRPILARLSESALSFHIGFSAAVEILRWVQNISRTKPDASDGRFTSRRGSAAACRSAATAGFTASRTQHLHAGCVPSRTRKRPKSARKTLKSLPKPSTKSVGDSAGGRPFKLTADKRNQAAQAFWAMHVETLNWSGMTLTHYAAATKLSKSSLCRWRNLIDSGEVEIDWRARLHPSARPQISSDVSSAAKDPTTETILTDRVPDDPPRDRRSNRRSFTNEEKLAIVMEAEQPGASVAAACSAFTRVTACTLALSPIRDTRIEGFSHFVTSMTAPIASGWSVCRVGLTPTGKRRLSTAHTQNRHRGGCPKGQYRPSPGWN
jgi:hypothetical protein